MSGSAAPPGSWRGRPPLSLRFGNPTRLFIALARYLRPLAPVRVGDTIGATVEITAIRPTTRGGRAVVTSAIRVANQHGAAVMDYTATRLIAGRDTAEGGTDQ